VIIAGAEDSVNQLFANHAGFRSRFDKIRIKFPVWTAEQVCVNMLIYIYHYVTYMAYVILLTITLPVV
jgi:hypothetical protein